MKLKILIFALVFSALYAGVVQSRMITGYDSNYNYEQVKVEAGKYYPGISLYPQLGATILFPSGGGTGKGTATTSDIGSVLMVSSSNPFVYKFAATSSLGITVTETDPIWTAFLANPIFTNLTSTNFYATNTLFINATSTNLFAGALTFTTASGTSLTSTNAFFTNLNLTNLTATSITSTNANFTGLTFTNASGTMLTSTTGYFTKMNINTTSPLGTVMLKGVSGVDPIRVVSSSAAEAQLFAVKAGGQVIVGANSLAQTGQLSVETPTTNDYALTFTNGSTYTFALGKQPGTSGQAFIGGLSGTTLNLWSGGSSRMVILNTNGNVGINSTTPYSSLSVKGTAGQLPFTITSSTNAVFMTILQNGNVGIGSTTPYSLLSVGSGFSVSSAGIVNAAGGVLNAATCWKNTTTLGYCSSAVGAGGLCTCN